MKFVKLLLLMLIPILGFSQTLKVGDGVQVVHFNANWNAANDVKWIGDLTDCKVKRCDIATDTKAQDKWQIVFVPTIIVFKDGEEVKRFQADISFTMKATKEEVQEVIDDNNQSDF